MKWTWSLEEKDNKVSIFSGSFIYYAKPLLAKNTVIDTAKFEEPGIIGAALLAKTELNKSRNNGI